MILAEKSEGDIDNLLKGTILTLWKKFYVKLTQKLIQQP